MREIQLTKGQTTKVDDSWYDDLMRYKWYAQWNEYTQSYYAVRGFNVIVDGRAVRRVMSMHRHVMGLQFGDKRQCDHRSHDTLDNQTENLRVCTRSQNQMNRDKTCRNVSGFRGVSYLPRWGKWKAYIKKDGIQKHLGLFATLEEAKTVRLEAEKRLFGEYGFSNVTV